MEVSPQDSPTQTQNWSIPSRGKRCSVNIMSDIRNVVVVKHSLPTSNGNIILTVKLDGHVVKTPFGSKTMKDKYCIAVDATADDIPAIGAVVAADFDDYRVVLNENTISETDEETGDIVTTKLFCKWLHMAK